MTATLRLEEGGKTGPGVVRLRGHPLDGHLCPEPMAVVRRRIVAIRAKLDLPPGADAARLAIARDGLRDLDVLVAELRRYGASPWRQLQDIATAVRAGGRRHAFARLAQLVGPVAGR